MTVTKLNQKKLITPERASVLFPTIISSIIVLIVFSAFVIPKFIYSNRVYFELKEFLRKKDELPNLKLQALDISKKLEKLNTEKYKILNLISGDTNLDTFLNRLDLLALNNDIKVVSITPKTLVKYIETEENNNSVAQNINFESDSLLVEGLKKNIIDVNLISNFSNLLSFLNDIEFQENVILMRNTKLKPIANDQVSEKKKDANLLEVSLEMIIYGKI